MSVGSSLCNFWVIANKVFKALASSFQCCCQQHDARLLLRHRESRKTELDITFLKGTEPSRWELCGTRVIETDDEASHTIEEAGSGFRSVGRKHIEVAPVKSYVESNGSRKYGVKSIG